MARNISCYEGVVNPYEAPKAEAVDARIAARLDATWAIVLGAVSLVLCAPITAPFALWKAVRALRVHTFARAVFAIFFAIFGLLSSVFLWALAIWQFLTPAQ